MADKGNKMQNITMVPNIRKYYLKKLITEWRLCAWKRRWKLFLCIFFKKQREHGYYFARFKYYIDPRTKTTKLLDPPSGAIYYGPINER